MQQSLANLQAKLRDPRTRRSLIAATVLATAGLATHYALEVARLEAEAKATRRQLEHLATSLADLRDDGEELELLSRQELLKTLSTVRTETVGDSMAVPLDFADEPRAGADPAALVGQVDRLGERLAALVFLTKNRDQIVKSLPTMAPADGFVSSDFGMRRSPTNPALRIQHKGIDFAAPKGSPVVAAGDGVVRFAGPFGGFGRYVAVDHGFGIVTKYAHNSRLFVKTGDTVRRGQAIAAVGNSGRSAGIHLHFEVWIHDRPIDPRLILPALPTQDAWLASRADASEPLDVPEGDIAALEAAEAPAVELSESALPRAARSRTARRAEAIKALQALAPKPSWSAERALESFGLAALVATVLGFVGFLVRARRRLGLDVLAELDRAATDVDTSEFAFSPLALAPEPRQSQAEDYASWSRVA